MSMEDDFEQFHEQFLKEKATENVEIKRIYIRSHFIHIISHKKFDLAKKENYGEFLGTFKGVDVYDFSYFDISFDEAQMYQIVSEVLWKICPECLNQKMYDGKNEVHYCPMCDNRRTRFKDKLFNALR